MTQKGSHSFQFYNAVSPIYVGVLLLQLQHDQWYSTAQLVSLLRSNKIDIDGSGIVSYNTRAWSLVGLGQIEKRGSRFLKKNIFRLTELGKQLIDTYSTNAELFYDLIHFLFYSAYHRSNDIRRARFWLYASVCDRLWQEAPASVDTSTLTNRLQIESHVAFPGYNPSFSTISVGGVFPWLQTLVPPFLTKYSVSQVLSGLWGSRSASGLDPYMSTFVESCTKQSTMSQRYSSRRSYCTPQLFHLATDLVYTTMEGLQYGASLAINDRHIESICKPCLLNPEHFWDMAELTQMTVERYEIRQGQWGGSKWK